MRKDDNILLIWFTLAYWGNELITIIIGGTKIAYGILTIHPIIPICLILKFILYILFIIYFKQHLKR